MINKQGLLFHWLVLGLLLAVGVFLAITNRLVTPLEPAGQWPVNFVANAVIPAEVDLLNSDQLARQTGWEVAQRLASSGGFPSDSACGQVDGFNLWNSLQKWCIPVVKQVASDLIDFQIAQTKVSFAGTIMLAEGVSKTVNLPGNTLQQYEYRTDLAVDLYYSFDEYVALERQARELVQTCKDVSDLQLCLSNNKKPFWNLCGKDVVGKIVLFCVDSPNNYIINDQLVTYKFGLDFNFGVNNQLVS